ncbi:hypothetical protein JOB18_040658 [Solea senegalensis]|uniref:Uncharacterized protein n=1 Tax=Solea senegalensis TaxID=28829 RepID=A0AAV6RHY0_SOLSE|nr:hypothetical protein JOB18_040658 [Solea senegalensis]
MHLLTPHGNIKYISPRLFWLGAPSNILKPQNHSETSLEVKTRHVDRWFFTGKGDCVGTNIQSKTLISFWIGTIKGPPHHGNLYHGNQPLKGMTPLSTSVWTLCVALPHCSRSPENIRRLKEGIELDKPSSSGKFTATCSNDQPSWFTGMTGAAWLHIHRRVQAMKVGWEI